jgi:hypothetical protein
MMRAGGKPESNLLPLIITLLLALPFAPEIGAAIEAEAAGAAGGARTIAALRAAWPKIKDVVALLPRFARSGSNQSGLSFDEFLKEIQSQLNRPTTPSRPEARSPATSIAPETTDPPNEPIEPQTPESVLKSARQRLVDAKVDHLAARPDSDENISAVNRGLAKKIGDEVGFETSQAFQKVNGRAGDGQQWHHILPQHESNIENFGKALIHSIPNQIILSIDAYIKINAHYSTKPNRLHGLTVMDWLKGQSFDSQHEYGIRVITYRLYDQKDTIKDLKKMSCASLVEIFADAAAAYGRALEDAEPRLANKAYDVKASVY